MSFNTYLMCQDVWMWFYYNRLICWLSSNEIYEQNKNHWSRETLKGISTNWKKKLEVEV